MKPRSYGPFPYSPIIDRPPLNWPKGAHVALWVIPNIEYFSMMERPGGYGANAKIPDVMMWSERDYGNRVGVFRMMDTLDKHGVRATVALNSDVCTAHPRIIEEGEKRNWEWMGHNQTNTRRLNEAEPGEEPKIIADTFATIEKHTGKRPQGWLGAGLQETWDTLDHLIDNGCRYVADWCNDDQPYPMTMDDSRTILSVPYSLHLNDKSALEMRYGTPADFEKMICDQFDVLYREGEQSGRVMAIALHPYLIGAPYRIGALDRALAYISRHEKVWKATGSEIAQHYLAQSTGG